MLLFFPVFRGATLASSLAHYLKSGKDPVIFSIHSLSLTGCLHRWGEWRDGRKKEEAGREGGRDGELKFGWGLGHWRKPDAAMKRKPDPEKVFTEMCVL